MQRIYLNETAMLVMTALGLFSFVVLLGTYAYSGSVFPSEQISDGGHTLITWLLWLAFVVVLIGTALLWALRIVAARKK